ESIVDLQLVLLAVAAVADAPQRTVRALEVARGEVIEGEAAFAQMARGELALDHGLALEQPVHPRMQIILIWPASITSSGSSNCRRSLIGTAHAELLGERAGVPPAGGGELGVRSEHTRRDQCADAIAFGA